MYWQYILILLIMRRLHLSSLYVGHVCIIKRPRSFNAFRKSFDAESFTRCKIVFWFRFRQNENGHLLRCDLFALRPLIFILKSFVKRFSKKLCDKSSLYCDFSDWKHVRTIATCKKKRFSSRKFPETMFCCFWKIWSQSNEFDQPFHTFAIRIKGI